MSQSQFHIIDAAAGSGKTFSLVFRYLKQLLSLSDSMPYRKMLALTFTNKAVNEMKSRIITALYELSLRDEKGLVLEKKLCSALDISPELLSQRAGGMLKSILKDYGAFDVITLDTFTHRLVRTFSKDLKLPYGFEVVLQPDELLNEVVLSIIDEAGKDAFLTHILSRFSLEKLQGGKSWDIEKDLKDFIKTLLNENDRLPLIDFKNKSQKDLEQEYQFLKQELAASKAAVKNLAFQILEQLQQQGLSKDEFSRGTLVNHFTAISEGATKDLYKNQLELSLLGEKPLYPKSVAPDIVAVIEAFRPQLLEAFQNIRKKMGWIELCEQIQKAWVPTALLKMMENRLDELQQQSERMLLGQFNNRIQTLLKNEPAPYIYERLGERFNHFFIDEFQDTSTLQWENLLPLMGNALESETLEGGKGSALLVGDPKQAIYRWRGGDVFQFVNLLEGAQPFQVQSSLERLPVNYRSKDVLVHFNNAFFKNTAKFLEHPLYKKLYETGSQQRPNQKAGGYVRLQQIASGGNKDEMDEKYVAKTREVVNELTEKGVAPSEIAILVRKKDQAASIASALIADGKLVFSSESLAVATSSSVQALLALFQLTQNPNTAEHHKIFLDRVWETTDSATTSYHAFISRFATLSTRDLFRTLQSETGYDFNFKKFQNLPLYEALEYAEEHLPCIDFNSHHVLFFREDVYGFSKSHSNSVASYLTHWESQGDQLRVELSETAEAIQVMTIHKAKGLEFPIVILPFLYTPLQPKLLDKVWLSMADTPLSAFHWAWLNFSKKLTTFGPSGEMLYEKHRLNNQLDAINVLYVALTRAVSSLYLITEEDTGRVEVTYSKLFSDFVGNQNSERRGNLCWEWGIELKYKKNSEINDTSEKPYFVLPRSSINWRQKLIFQDKIFNPAIEKGNQIHELLARIRTYKDIPIVIEDAVSQEILNKEEIPFIQAQLEEICNHPQLQACFDDKGEILIEQDLLIPEGVTLRPDRVHLSKEKAIIIDYKTGAPNSSHHSQIESYATAFKKMGKMHIESHIVYLTNPIKIEKCKF